MEIKLEVLACTCIKQKKPWPRITWLGQEKEAVYLLDEKDINEINLVSGKTKKKIPQLSPLLKNVCVLTTSSNRIWLAGILKTGELFLWHKDQGTLKTVPAAEETTKLVEVPQESSIGLYLYVSDDGNKVLLTTPTACVFLWENMECKSAPSSNPIMRQWSQINPNASLTLPSIEEKETTVNADFIQNEMLGDTCCCSFAFYSEENLMFTFLEIKWQENSFKSSNSFPCQIHWAQQTCSLSSLTPPCESIKSRGALLTALSRDGLVLAVAVNQKDPQSSQILFISTMNFLTASGSLKGCGSKNRKVSPRFIRSYWIADMSWTPDSLFLACMLKRGSLILMTSLGELLTLVTYGCSIEFGPAEFIPLHPLITYRSQDSLLRDSNHSHDSSASERDLMRQRFSITSHPCLPYLVASDGYIITVLKFSDSFSPSTYMRSLLLDSAQRLEKLHSLISSKGKRLSVQSLTSLRANLLHHHQNQISAFSAIPKFLQEEEGATEVLGEATCSQEYNDEFEDDNLFHSYTFIQRSQKADTYACDEGRLEFAAMFDTIHAMDECDGEKDAQFLELNYIQKNLIAAWRVGISRNTQERDMLLSCTIRCITHFFNALQHAKLCFEHLDNPVKNHPWIQCVLKCFQQYLTVLTWDSKHRQTLGHLMKLTAQTLKLMLTGQQDQMFFGNLLGGFSLLKMVSHFLNGKNKPQYAILPTVLDMNNMVELDSIVESLFQIMDLNNNQNFCALDFILNLPVASLTNNQEKRLIIMWRLLYKHVLLYWTQFNRKEQTEMQMVYERPVIEALATHIQAILQSSGERLEHKLNLSSVTGEEQFLTGSYEDSVEAWKKAIQETKVKGGKKMPFLQTRYYLAILYCHLYHYRLSEAQGLCDHLVNELLKRSQISATERNDISDAEWRIKDICTGAALAVVQSLARFMAAYFANEPLYVLPPHCVDILSPLHIKQDRLLRVVPLEHSIVTDAVRDLGLSCVWTVEYALDLLLVGGLIPESVWLAHKLGDWKMAVSIGVAYDLYCQSNNGIPTSPEKAELYLPLCLTPTQIFQEKLQSFLGQAVNFEASNDQDPKYKQLTDPIEEEDASVLFNSVEEILKAAVMAEADILSETFQLLVDFAKDLSRKLQGLVPESLYLPAPPLYCPQPTFLSEEECTDLPLRMERSCRQKISGVVQRILVLFQAAHCSFPSAQWYITQLKHTRKIMQKIHKKGGLPSLNALPENLLNYCKYRTVFLRPTSSGDHKLDEVSCKTIGCFRELCALSWMLHVREKLSASCRRYQTARENLENQNECMRTESDSCVIEYSLSALEWACRMLPFARFMNIEELIQDIILSLTGELPPIKKVAEILVKAFPNPEDVRVPLRDKYNALHQRLRHCKVKGPNSEEIMSVVIQAAHKVNVTALKRVMRNIGAPQRNIWEPLEVETQDPGVCCYDRFSLGTSLSRSTVSDLGNPPSYSDAETADSFSESLWSEEIRKYIPVQVEEGCKHLRELTGCDKYTEKIEDFTGKGRSTKKQNNKDCSKQQVLPLVGEWEFERDDDEYVKFLELFITYILERDLISHRDSSIPFLVSFSALLREQELSSLLFDVHTTLKRRQIATKGQNIFRAGSCYALVFDPSHSQPESLSEEKTKDSKKRTLPVPIQKPIEFYDHKYVMKLAKRRGLFGLRQQSIHSPHDSSKKILLTPLLSQHSSEETSFPKTSAVHKFIYKPIRMNDVVQREEPTPEMKFKFNHVAHLLEWMIRWSDRRLLYDPMAAEPFQECQPKMHVKISASAVLASMWLLEEYYSSKSEDQSIHIWKPHLQSANTHSSAIRSSKLEKENSVDTGYSPSVETPVVIQDGHAYGEPCESTPRNVPAAHFEEENNFKDHSETHDTEIEGKYVDAHLIERVGGAVDLTSENEEHCEDPVPLSVSSSISISVKSIQQHKEYVPIADVEYTQDKSLMEALEGKVMKNGVTCETIPSDVARSLRPEMKAKTASTETTLSDDEPSFTAVSSILSNEPVGQEKKEAAPARESTVQPLSTSEAVRQMLQDEMFKLVQLQQINFMSLMQVVGSSFASLPNLSQQMHQTQPFQLGRNQALNAGETDIESSVHKHPADGFPKTEMPTQENSRNVNVENTGLQGQTDLSNQNRNGTILSSLHISDSSHLPESQSSGRRLIPPFQSWLPQIPAQPLPLLSVSLSTEKKPQLIPMAKPINSTDGFPLLKLKPNYEFQPFNSCSIKPPEVFIGPWLQQSQLRDPPPHFVKNPQELLAQEHKNGLTAHLNLNNYDLEGIRQAQEQKKNWGEPMSKDTSRHSHWDQDERKENTSHSQYFHVRLKAEKPMADNEIPFHTIYENSAQIPLLYLKSCTQSNYPKTSIPVKITEKDIDSRDPVWQTGLPLLHANFPPLLKYPTPKLIPLQNLVAFEQSHQDDPIFHIKGKDHPEKIQLLKADIPANKARQEKKSKKRQKRLVKKQIKEKEEREKKSVTFQQDDSTGLADTTEQTKDKRAEFSYDLGDGDILLNPKMAISSAGLHYMASVGKKATDLQENSTNTDTVLKSHQNTQTDLKEIIDESGKNQPITFASVSTSVTGLQPCEEKPIISEEVGFEPRKDQVPSSAKDILPSLPPDLYLNLTFPTEATEQPLPFSSNITSDLAGRKYINVIDIEDGDLMKDLPDISESTPKPIASQAVKAEFPTFAKLHHMAASVTNIIPPKEFEKEGDTLHTESMQVPETKEREVTNDPLTTNLLHENFSATSSRRLSPRKISREHISAKLQNMDRQLESLQNVAERMEKEFRNTKLAVEAVEGLVADPRNNSISFFAPDVKVTKDEYYSTRVIIEDLEEEEEEEGLETKSSQNSYLSLETPSVSPSVSTANLLRVKKSSSGTKPTDINFSPEGLDESISEDHLQITGLSGISDIITDLIVEEGISASELGLTETQAQKISRFSSAMSKQSSKIEKEKKELQAWMKKKRKARLDEYLQTLTEQRAKEHSPFPLGKQLSPRFSSRDIKLHQKKKDKRDKALFSEHHNLRVSEALSLMDELLTDTMQLPSHGYKQGSASDFKRPWTASSRSFRGSRQAARNKAAAKADFQKTRSFGVSSDVIQRRGQIRQAPYRKIPSEDYQGQMRWRSSRSQRKWSNSSFDLRSEASDRISRLVNQRRFPNNDPELQANDESEDDALSVWSVPGDIQQILYGNSKANKESFLQEDASSITSFNNFDSVSESTSSILSKLDWKAVEALVANVEEK
ncbi:ciliogenesis and planar polarity effector 1 isoform X2 [Anolis carolinensis]|uniref:ciliogenesis and planar polarity effector 1 isoform X2 n=1 Tax=Anolis carolinensis TaxID=28377 RepID=UPI002F2B683C